MRLHVADRGPRGAEPILLITGWTISSAIFDPIAPLYPDLRIITYDHRGTGRSGPWPAPVSMAMLAADAARVLDDLGVRAAHVVGLSMGAMVALELAVRMPDRLKSLVLVGGGAGGPMTAIPSLPSTARVVGELVGDATSGRWPAAVLFSRRFREEQPRRVAELCRPFGRHRAPPWATSFQTLATSCFARDGSLHRVRAPTLVVHGDEDVMSPLANATRLAAGIPGARLHIERGCGHAVPLERAQSCADLLHDWVGLHADNVPAPAGPATRAGERLSRPLALHAGAARNARQVPAAVLRRLGWFG